jgi:hypothetical protein
MGRRGPKKKQDVKRERNGRMSRNADGRKHNTERNLADLDREQRDNLSIGLEARERIWGVKPQQSRDQKAGSAIGRYCLQGLVTQAQYDAAMLFLESYHRNLRAIDAPPQPGAVDLNRTHGLAVGLENVKQLTKWRAEHKATLAAIQDKQNEIRLMGNLYGALYEIVVRDHALEHLLGDLRTAANALVKHYRLDGRMAA